VHGGVSNARDRSLLYDADKHFAHAKKAGAKIFEEPAHSFYGHRRYGVADPERHQWYFFHEINELATNKPLT
jgi:uncharacterized glyoxalase superfamily protein PhnB